MPTENLETIQNTFADIQSNDLSTISNDNFFCQRNDDMTELVNEINQVIGMFDIYETDIITNDKLISVDDTNLIQISDENVNSVHSLEVEKEKKIFRKLVQNMRAGVYKKEKSKNDKKSFSC